MAAKLIPFRRTGSGTLTTVSDSPVFVYLSRLSPGSRRVMLHHLERIAAFFSDAELSAEHIPWDKLRYEHAAALRAHLSETLAPSTANAALSAFRGVLKEAWRLGQLPGDLYQRLVDVQGVKGSRLPSGRALTRGEVRALFGACARDGTAAGCRDAALLAVLVGAGLRRVEVAALTVTDIAHEGGEAVVHGKGNRERTGHLPAGAKEAVATWLRVRGGWPGAVFCPINKGGKLARRAMTGPAIVQVLAKRGQQAGVGRFSPHDLRRTFIMHLLDRDVDIATVQRLAGHQSVTTTIRYDRRDEKVSQAAVDKLHLPYVNVWQELSSTAGPGDEHSGRRSSHLETSFRP